MYVAITRNAVATSLITGGLIQVGTSHMFLSDEKLTAWHWQANNIANWTSHTNSLTASVLNIKHYITTKSARLPRPNMFFDACHWHLKDVNPYAPWRALESHSQSKTSPPTINPEKRSPPTQQPSPPTWPKATTSSTQSDNTRLLPRKRRNPVGETTQFLNVGRPQQGWILDGRQRLEALMSDVEVIHGLSFMVALTSMYVTYEGRIIQAWTPQKRRHNRMIEVYRLWLQN